MSPNSRFGHFLSLLVNNYADCECDGHECVSSEDMRAAIEEYNNCDIEHREECRIVNMDVKALYPSMLWPDIIRAVRDMIERSNMKVENVNWREAGKYLSV